MPVVRPKKWKEAISRGVCPRMLGKRRAQTLGPHDLDRTHQPLTKIIAKTEDSYPHADCF